MNRTAHEKPQFTGSLTRWVISIKHSVTSMAKQIGWCAIIFSALSCEDASLIKCAWNIFNWNRWFHGWVCWSVTETLQKGCLHLFNENSDNKYLYLFLVGIPSAKLQSLSSWGCCWVLANTAPFVRCNVLVVDTWPGVPWTKQKLCVGPVPRIFRWEGLEMIEVRCRFIEKLEILQVVQLLLKTRWRGSTSPFPATTSGILAWTSLQATNSRRDAEMASGQDIRWGRRVTLGGFWWSRWRPTPARTARILRVFTLSSVWRPARFRGFSWYKEIAT